MGGHGGLNILPQKKWNVYGRENRLKVARDEEAAAEVEGERQQRHQLAEREFRHKALLERARQRHYGDQLPAALPGEACSAAADAGRLPVEHVADQSAMAALEAMHTRPEGEQALPSAQRCRRRARPPANTPASSKRPLTLAEIAQQMERSTTGGEGALQPAQAGSMGGKAAAGGAAEGSEYAAAAQLEAPVAAAPSAPEEQGLAAPQRLQHVNLFAAEEALAKNPENMEDQRAERRRRGADKTQTSDARFDASFQFAHGVAGPAAQVPWYAQAGSTLPSELQRLETEAGREPPPADSLLPHSQLGSQEAAPLLLAGVTLIGGSEGKRRTKRGQRSRSRSEGSDSEGRGGAQQSTLSRKSKQRGKEKRRQRHSKRRHSSRERAETEAVAKAAVYAALREERLHREAGERQRQAAVVRVAAGREGEPQGARYHSAFGR